MEKIAQLLQSYFHFRAATLRSITSENVSRSELSRLTGLCANAISGRKANPDLWQPVDIYQVAVKFGSKPGSNTTLARLAPLINELPDEERYRFLKDSSVRESKFKERLKRSDSWLQSELVRMFAVVRPK